MMVKFPEPIPIEKLSEHKERAYVYALILNGIIVYVGSSTNVYQRIKDHISKIEFDHFCFCEVDFYKRKEVERDAILQYKPVLNDVLPCEHPTIKKLERICCILHYGVFPISKFMREYGDLAVFKDYFDSKFITPIVTAYYKEYLWQLEQSKKEFNDNKIEKIRILKS